MSRVLRFDAIVAMFTFASKSARPRSEKSASQRNAFVLAVADFDIRVVGVAGRGGRVEAGRLRAGRLASDGRRREGRLAHSCSFCRRTRVLQLDDCRNIDDRLDLSSRRNDEFEVRTGRQKFPG